MFLWSLSATEANEWNSRNGALEPCFQSGDNLDLQLPPAVGRAGEGSLVGLSSQSVGYDVISKQIVSELSGIIGHQLC